MRKILRKIVASMLCFMIIVSTLPDLSQTFAEDNPLDHINGISIKCNSIHNEANIKNGVIDYPFKVQIDGWDDTENISIISAKVTISTSESVLLLKVNDDGISTSNHNTYKYNLWDYDIEHANFQLSGTIDSNAKIETKTIKNGLAAVYLNVSVTLEYNETQKTLSATQELQLKGKESNNYPKIFFKKQHKDPAINNYQTLEPGCIDEDNYVKNNLEDLYRYSQVIDAQDLAKYGDVGKIKLPKPGEEQHTSKLKCRLKEWILVRKEKSDTYFNGIKKEEGTIRQLDDTDWYEFTVGNCDVYLIARYANYEDYILRHFLKNPITNQYDSWKHTDVSIESSSKSFNPPSYYEPLTGYHFAKYDESNSGDEIAGCFNLYYDLNQYTVTLNANGGSVGTGSVTTTYSKGDYCSLSWNTPTRTGYIFDGWYTQASGGTKVYNADGSCTNEGTYWSGNLWQYDGNPTFYAHWTPITYTVAYNGNGATEGSTSSTTHTYDSSTNLATNGFKRKYTVKFEGNGGSTPSNQVSEYGFHRWRQYANNTGWEFNNARN